MGEVLRLAQGWRWLPLLLNPSRWNGRSVEPLVWAVLISGAGGYFLPGALSPITMVTAETGDDGAARAVAIVGQASVIDGDTIEVHGARIRLHGIDAPASDQLCVIREEEVSCGQQAAIPLTARIGRATVRCEPNNSDKGRGGE